ncbi:MAG: 50S ribosomal protein L25 [Phycisphaerae bacterium]
MSETITLSASTRTSLGTRSSRVLRKEGRLPAVVYGHGEAVQAIAIDQREFELAQAHGAYTLQVDIDGKTEQCLIKDVQYDYLGTTPIHLDLARVNLDERVRVRVGIELRGTPKGAVHGGTLDQHMAEIELECLVSAIPEVLQPLVTDLEVGDSLYVKDLTLADGVRALVDGDERVATVHAMAAAEASEDEESEADAAEPERIGRVRKDDDASEGSS